MELDLLAQRQHGLVTTAQLRALGWTPGRVGHALRSGHLVRARLGVFRLRGAPVTSRQAVLAAALGAARDVVVSHESAAELWSFRAFPEPEGVHLLAEGRWQPRMEGVEGHQSISLPAADRTVLDRIPVTTVERTLIDGCGLVPFPALERCADDLLRRGVLVLRKLVRCFEAVPVSGRRKSGPVAALLRDRVPGFHPGGSDRELHVMRVLKRAGIDPLPVQQHRVKVEGRTYRLDFAWPETRHYLEFDGFEAHSSLTSFHADRDRMRVLQRAGWTPWHVTARTSPSELVTIGLAATADIAAA